MFLKDIMTIYQIPNFGQKSQEILEENKKIHHFSSTNRRLGACRGSPGGQEIVHLVLKNAKESYSYSAEISDQSD